MAKRFTATEIWDEDWFLSAPCEYKLFWFYILSKCDHAGIYKVNLTSFKLRTTIVVESKKALEYFNDGKERIRILNATTWLVEDFFVYQYGQNFNINNRLHKSVGDIYNKNGVKLRSIRGLIEVK